MERFKRRNWKSVLKLVLEKAGPVFDNLMERYNDIKNVVSIIQNLTLVRLHTNKTQNKSSTPYSSWGEIIKSAVYEKNIAVKDVKGLQSKQYKESLRLEGQLLGSLWSYCSLKHLMIQTLAYGWKESGLVRKDGEKIRVIQNEVSLHLSSLS
jgi:hypothetical protein